MDVVRSVVFLASGVVSSTATALNLCLLCDMKKWTGHTKLLALMSVYQLMFDMSFYTTVSSTPGTIENAISILISEVGGCSSSFVSNLMMLSIYYIVVYKESLSINENLFLIHILVNIPSFILLIMFIIALSSGNWALATNTSLTYSALRMLSVVLNIVPYTYMSYRLHTAPLPTSTYEETSRAAVAVLVRRMKYYPLVQGLSRVAPSWYEFQYGFNFSSSQVSLVQYCASVAIAVFCPLASVGYLIIFLQVQPLSWKHLMSRLSTCKRYAPAAQNEFLKEYSDNPIHPSTKVFNTSFTLPNHSHSLSVSTSARSSGRIVPVALMDEAELINLIRRSWIDSQGSKSSQSSI